MGWFDWLRRRPSATEPDNDNDDDDDDDDDDADAGDDIDPGQPQLTEALDLHTFQPRDVTDLVAEYLHAAREAGFATVRIIHGKGKGTLRRTVHAVLDTHPAVRGYRLGDQRSGSWGATLVDIAPLGPS